MWYNDGTKHIEEGFVTNVSTIPRTLILIDGSGCISVSKEKELLVQEVIKHFTPRWQQELVEGKEANSTQQVTKMLTRLSVEFEIVSEGPVMAMEIANSIPSREADIPNTATDNYETNGEA